MFLRILFSVVFLTCLFDLKVFSANLFKSIAIHEVEESVIEEQIRAAHRTAFTTTDSVILPGKPPSYNYCRTLSKIVGSKHHWRDASLTWQKRFRKFGYWVCFRDCGGGGDCLYNSIISSLNLTSTNVYTLRKLIADQFVGLNTTSIYNSYGITKAFDIKNIIDVNGEILNVLNSTNITHSDSNSTSNSTSNSMPNSTDPLSNWNETTYLERMGILATMEAFGEWKDSWSPSSILNNSFYYGTDISTNIKKALLVHKLLSKPGNTHWGTQWDVDYIEKIYNVKVVILWKNRGIFYPTLGSQVEFTKIVLIYYDDVIGHFQVIGIKKMNSPLKSDLISVFSKDKIPTSLKKLYKDDTNNDLD
ncbi:uncharacterized protein ELE39_003394 [Cryptosporidium sp. chipmunk genotype I]|uniref:uncharacterized protein n=1 Tax=Cryptosporidium sp. chipmunk genotype I TaxID=1280935 RepID=UPI003519E9F0|nr:hypothetical protein ELE39_003394 [Cryptosporidium sp. chipmunk genotype I]